MTNPYGNLQTDKSQRLALEALVDGTSPSMALKQDATIPANALAPGSVARSLEEKLQELPTAPGDYGAMGDGTTLDTVAVQAWAARAAGVPRRLSNKVYLIDASSTNDNPSQSVFEGAGAGSGIKAKAGLTDPVLVLGSANANAHLITLRDLAINANSNTIPYGVIRYIDCDRIHIDNVVLSNIGASVGIANLDVDGSSVVQACQEWYAVALEIMGNAPTAGTGVDLTPTGATNWLHCNIENLLTAIKLRPRGYVPFVWTGGHIERCKTALDLEDAQAFVTGLYGLDGRVALGQGCVGGRLEIGAFQATNIDGYISDLGMGNSWRVAASLANSGDPRHERPALTLRGDEWLQTENVVQDPVFQTGTTGWTGTNATLSNRPVGIPGVGRGQILTITPSASNGYASRTFTVSANTDYLLQVGFVLTTGNYGNCRVEVYDGVTSIYDSGALSYSAPISQCNRWRFLRQRIPSGSATSLTIRIYGVASGVETDCCFVGLHPSTLRMDTMGSTGSVSGSGYAQVLNWAPSGTGSLSFSNSAITHRFGGFVHLVAEVVSGSFQVGVGGHFSEKTNGPLIPLETGVNTLCIPVGQFPSTSKEIDIRTLAAGEINIRELTVHRVWPIGSRRVLSCPNGATISANGSVTLHSPLAIGRLARVLFVNGQTIAADGTGAAIWVVTLSRRRSGSGATIATWSTQTTGFTIYTPVEFTISGNDDLQPGDILYATYTKTGSPSAIVAPTFTFEIIETSLR